LARRAVTQVDEGKVGGHDGDNKGKHLKSVANEETGKKFLTRRAVNP